MALLRVEPAYLTTESVQAFENLNIINLDFQGESAESESDNSSKTKKMDGNYELVCFALLRDIDFESGIYLLPTILQEAESLTGVNCVHLCDNKIFSFGSNYLMQPDYQDLVMRKGIVDDRNGTQDRFVLTEFK